MTSTTSNRHSNLQAWVAAELPRFSALWPPIGPKKRRRFRTRPEITARGLDRKEAAELVGLSPTRFDRARREGRYPGPTLPGGKYDRNLLDQIMNGMSGLNREVTPASALDDWRKRGSRSH